jgi:hypothetical protein
LLSLLRDDLLDVCQIELGALGALGDLGGTDVMRALHDLRQTLLRVRQALLNASLAWQNVNQIQHALEQIP